MGLCDTHSRTMAYKNVASDTGRRGQSPVLLRLWASYQLLPNECPQNLAA